MRGSCSRRGVMLGVPFGTGTAHVMQLWPVGISHEGLEHSDQLGQLPGQPRSRTPAGNELRRTLCDAGHDALLALVVVRDPACSLVDPRSVRVQRTIGPISLKFGRKSLAFVALIAINVARELRKWWTGGCSARVPVRDCTKYCALAPAAAPRYISGEFPYTGANAKRAQSASAWPRVPHTRGRVLWPVSSSITCKV